MSKESINTVSDYSDEIEIDLGKIFHTLISKLWIIVLCFVIGAAAMFASTKMLMTPQYQGKAMIYVLSSTTSITSVADIQIGQQLTVDFEVVAKSRPVVEKVISKLDLETDYEETVEMLSTENPAETRILNLIVENEDPKLAKDMANTWADVTAAQIADIMNTDKPTILEKAVVPDEPSSPNTMKNTAIGAIVGALVAIAVLVIRFIMNDTLQTTEDIEKYLGLNNLAVVPLEKRKKSAK